MMTISTKTYTQLQDQLAAVTAERDAERLKVAQMEPVAAFGHQCIQDQCENAYVEQTVHKQLREELDALAAALERVLDAAKSYRSDILGLSKDGPNDPCFAALNYAPKWVPRDLSIHIAETCAPTSILAERDQRIRRETLEEAANEIDDTWGRAYPNVGIFLELEKGAIPDDLLSRASAGMGRYMADRIANQLRTMSEEPKSPANSQTLTDNGCDKQST